MPTPHIRLAVPEDLPACAAIYVEAFSRPPYHEEWSAEDACELLGLLRQRESDLAFVLTLEARVIGFAFCSTLGKYRAVVEEIAVHPDLQRQGGGRYLLDHCLSVFRQRGYPMVELIANREAPAYHFYQRLGFRPARRNLLMLREL